MAFVFGLNFIFMESDISCDPNPCPSCVYPVCCMSDGSCKETCPMQYELLGGIVQKNEFQCYPGLCGGSPSDKHNWGDIKNLYQ